jgi:hypothetical protein
MVKNQTWRKPHTPAATTNARSSARRAQITSERPALLELSL